MQNTYITMHRLIRRIQQKNRFVGKVQHSGLSLAETHFLLELQADQTRSTSELSALLQIDQSFGTRIAQNLTRKNLLKSRKSKTDSRRKELVVTADGRRMIEKIDSFADGLIAQFAQGLSKTEFNTITVLARDIADGYQQPSGIRRKGESEFRVQQRRVTRAFKLLGEHVFDSSLTATQWQTITEVARSPVAPQISELSLLLGVAQNSLSSVIDFLEDKGWLKRVPDSTDKRKFLLVATRAGEEFCKKIEKTAAEGLRQGLIGWKKDDLLNATRILSRFVGENETAMPPLLPGFQLAKAVTKSERAAARSFAARTLVAQGREEQIPEHFIPADSSIYLLKEAENCSAVLELSSSNSDKPRIVWSCAASHITPWVMCGFVNSVYFASGMTGTFSLKRFVADRELRRVLKV